MIAPLHLPLLADLTPQMAAVEFAKARYFLSICDPAERLIILAKLAQRYRRSQLANRLSNVVDIPGRLWEAAEATNIVADHGEVTVHTVMMSALQAAEDRPTEDADKPRAIHATPYAWKDPSAIPRREWLYGYMLIRKFVSATVSPGGVGKSSLIAAEALAKVSGKDLLGIAPPRQLRVWLWNLEDPQEETERKIQAAAIHYRLSPDDIGDRLFVDSGRDQPLVIATATRTGAVIARPVIDAMIGEIESRGIDVVIIDPFVSCHEVAENDNTAMDMIVKEWGKVAERGRCAIHLVHHTRKMGAAESEVTAESSRGGKALTDGCRVVRAINRMSKEEADRAGVESHRLYFRTLNDKANLQPPADQSDWFYLQSVDLGNTPSGIGGDSIGVVTAWSWPDPLAGMTGDDFEKAARAIRLGKWRENVQAKDWVGRAIAEALDLNLESKAERAKVIGMLKVWLSSGALIVVVDMDDKRMPRKFVQVREAG